MKNIKLYELEETYHNEESSLEYPTVSYTKDTEKVWYMKPSLYEWVDLGLPSGLKWAAWNVGATKPEEFGLYFAWGETQGYTEPTDQKQFSWADYKWSADENGNTMTKYPSDGSNTEGGVAPADMIEEDTTTLLTLLPEDDAATATDSGCRMPTSAECAELTANTTSEWVDDYNGTGVAGRIFTSNVNGNSIFVPAAGGCGEGSVDGVGQYGILWSSSLGSSYVQGAFYLYFYSDGVDVGSHYRCLGLPVRAVRV